ncbi:MAG TPA: hypothetical protein VN110_00225, partial [Sphingobium sp.]|nr:hypothetical protein [Sphingobium sp.]
MFLLPGSAVLLGKGNGWFAFDAVLFLTFGGVGQFVVVHRSPTFAVTSRTVGRPNEGYPSLSIPIAI